MARHWSQFARNIDVRNPSLIKCLNARSDCAIRRIASFTGEAMFTAMEQQLASIAFLVRDYDEAIAYFTGCFDLIWWKTPRWAPSGSATIGK